MADTRPFPSIAVIIPLYNKAAYIERALTSAFTQTSGADEIIVIDDASTDDGAARARQFSDSRLRILTRDRPGPGGYAARNTGIAQASSEWIAFLDADDYWRPDHLSEIRKAACAGDVGCVFTGYDDILDEGLVPHAVAPLIEARGQREIDFALFLKAWLRQHDCPIVTSASAFRRDLLIDAGLFPAGRAARGGDKDLWLRAMARTRAAFQPSRSAVFDRTAGNKVTRTTATSQPPLICETIAAMLAGKHDESIRAHLRALANQEIRYYARQTFARGAIPATMRAALYLPGGWHDWLILAGMEATPAPLARRIRATLRGAPATGAA